METQDSHDHVEPSTKLNQFAQSGEGLLGRFKFALFWTKQLANEVFEWSVQFQAGKRNDNPPKLFDTYIAWGEANELCELVLELSKEDLRFHQMLDPKIDVNALTAEFAEFSGNLAGCEKHYSEIFEKVLLVEFEKHLSQWRKMLAWAEAEPDGPDESPAASPNEGLTDFYWHRAELEWFLYALIAVQEIDLMDAYEAIKADKIPGRRLPSIDIAKIEDDIDALDDRFRKILAGRYDETGFWTDENFWWAHPPKDSDDN